MAKPYIKLPKDIAEEVIKEYSILLRSYTKTMKKTGKTIRPIISYYVYLYLLIKANYEDNNNNSLGITVKRGQILTSLERISTDLGLSVQQVRTAIINLTKTGLITPRKYRDFQVISMTFYDCQDELSTPSSTEQKQHKKNKENIPPPSETEVVRKSLTQLHKEGKI